MNPSSPLAQLLSLGAGFWPGLLHARHPTKAGRRGRGRRGRNRKVSLAPSGSAGGHRGMTFKRRWAKASLPRVGRTNTSPPLSADEINAAGELLPAFRVLKLLPPLPRRIAVDLLDHRCLQAAGGSCRVLLASVAGQRMYHPQVGARRGAGPPSRAAPTVSVSINSFPQSQPRETPPPANGTQVVSIFTPPRTRHG